MAVTFVIGRGGSGKTRHCFLRIVDSLRRDPLGPPIYWLLPRQATFEAERRLTCASDLPGTCRARVVSFAQLGKDISNERGGSAAPEVTAIGRQMILGHLLRSHAPKLLFFRSADRQTGLARELAATFDELERAGRTSADLGLLLDDLGSGDALDVEASTLRAKVHDVRLLYDSYVAFLGQQRLDPHRRFEQILAAVQSCGFLRGATIFVDSFIDFTDHERRMLAAIAKAGASMEITLLMDPDSPLLAEPHLNPGEMSLFHRTERTYRLLHALFADEAIEVNEPIKLVDQPRFRSPTLATLERRMFESQPGKPGINTEVGGAIEMISAPNRAAEVDAAARRIRALLAGGYRLRDIALLVRQIEPYSGLIQASFGEHGIPYFVDRRRTASHHPLIQFLRSALQAARHDWNHDAVMALTKTGLSRLTLDEADELENYVLAHRVVGSRWESPEPWTWRRDLLRQDGEGADSVDPLRIDGLRRRISDGLSPLVQLLRPGMPIELRKIATEIFATFDRFSVRQTLEQWIATTAESGRALYDAASLLEEKGEHEQVWARLVDLFDEMVDLLGDQPVLPDEFADIVEWGLESFDLGIAPPTVDQALVGAIDRTRCPPVKAVLVLGLNEGEFPAAPREQTVLTDRERRDMSRRKLELDPDGRRRLLDERLLGYITFTQPAERLILFRAQGDDGGRVSAPSFFWQRVKELFPSIEPEIVLGESGLSIGQIATPRQLVSGLMDWVRNPVEPAGDWLALYNWLAAQCTYDSPLRALIAAAWPALSYANTATLEPALAAQLFQQPLTVGVPQLETMAACPFKHFVRYGLRLSSRQRTEVGGIELGQVYHRVLERLVADAIRASRDENAPPLNITPGEIHAAAIEVARALRGELMLSSARNRYLLARIEKTLAEWLESQRAALRRGSFSPAHAAVAFGEGAGLPAVRVKGAKGSEIHIEGRMDRIDTREGSGDAIAIDYRLGAHTLSLAEVYHGLSLQLIVYLLAIEAGGEQVSGRALNPSGAFYVSLLRGITDVDHPDDAPDPSDEAYLLKPKPRGIFDENSLDHLDADSGEGWSDVVAAFRKKGGGFGNLRTSDCASSEELRGLMRRAESRISEIAGEIVAGKIDIAPYRLARQSPCAHCEFRGVCRFERPANRYAILAPMSREQTLEAVRGGGSDAG